MELLQGRVSGISKLLSTNKGAVPIGQFLATLALPLPSQEPEAPVLPTAAPPQATPRQNEPILTPQPPTTQA